MNFAADGRLATMKIAVLDDYQDVVSRLECFSLLSKHSVTVFRRKMSTTAQLIDELADFDAIVLFRERTHLTADCIAQLPKLKIISQTGRPGEHIDSGYCKSKNIAVLSGQGNPDAPAELTWALIMSAQRRLPQYMRSVQRGQWQSGNGLTNNPLMLGRSLRGKTLGVFGLGKIGTLVAGFGRAFQMRVLAYGQENSRKKAAELGYDFASSKSELFRTSDVLSVHLRCSGETRGIIGLTELESMKADSVFVNTSRAELVQAGAIETCLTNTTGPNLFALDVFAAEPVHKVQENDRLILTPHIGFVELETLEMYFSRAFKNILEFEKNLAK